MSAGNGHPLRPLVRLENPTGLPAIAYRRATHARFKASMLARLSEKGFPKLVDLRTRADDDFTVALLDAWATALDVLTFYDERLANESFLRTATERRSILAMARLIGYELGPGVAASADLVFTLEDALAAPARSTIPVGTKVQSIPEPGETAQTFETVEEVEARPEWNALRPRRTQPQVLKKNMDSVWIEGTGLHLRRGDPLLIVYGEGQNESTLRTVIRVAPDYDEERTRIDLVSLPKLIKKLMKAASSGSILTKPFTLSNSFASTHLVGKSWKQADLSAQMTIANQSLTALAKNVNTKGKTTIDLGLGRLGKVYLRPATPDVGVFSFGVQAAIFGHNSDLTEGKSTAKNLKHLADAMEGGDLIYLDGVYRDIVPGSWFGLRKTWKDGVTPSMYRVDGTSEVSISKYGITAKVTVIKARGSVPLASFPIRGTTVLAASDFHESADVPLPGPLEGNRVTLDGFYEGIAEGRRVIVRGERADMDGVIASEVHEAIDVSLVDLDTTLTLARDLAHPYVLDTVRVHANVARATHGDTVEEVLGSGDAAQPFQRFALRQPPLTHVSASTPSGSASTLEVRVDGIAWREVPTLFGHGPNDRVYVLRRDSAGGSFVRFGDGRTGARLPSGFDNVRAVYRRGTGADGLVQAGQISLLMSRPAGLKGAVNPLPSGGAEDPEDGDAARRNAPLTVLTLDRIVSLQDHEDFARAFGGIAKALATWTWDGEKDGVFVTVAGPDGRAVPAGGALHGNLVAAMRRAGDPHVPLRVGSYRGALFLIDAAVRVHPDHAAETVLSEIDEKLHERFSFDARSFGQDVTMSAVLAAFHEVAGVEAVDLNALHRFGEPRALHGRLVAELPVAGAAEPSAAELFTLDPRPVALEVMT